jgi:hypothetical protein
MKVHIPHNHEAEKKLQHWIVGVQIDSCPGCGSHQHLSNCSLHTQQEWINRGSYYFKRLFCLKCGLLFWCAQHGWTKTNRICKMRSKLVHTYEVRKIPRRTPCCRRIAEKHKRGDMVFLDVNRSTPNLLAFSCPHCAVLCLITFDDNGRFKSQVSARGLWRFFEQYMRRWPSEWHRIIDPFGVNAIRE